MVRFRILGPIECYRGERRCEFTGPRQLELLAVLLLHANRAVSADQLIDALWGERRSAGAAKRLQMAVARLRKALEGSEAGASGEPVLRTMSGGYLLAVAPGNLDAEVFEAGLDDGRRALAEGEPARAAGVLREALELWRGPALAELAYADFAQIEIRRLEELRLAALEARTDADLRLGRHVELIAELQRLTTRHPWRERLHAQLMLALYRSGRQADALETYGCARRRLVAEIGAEPGPELRRLQEAILHQDASLELAPSAADVPGELGIELGPGLREPQPAISGDDRALNRGVVDLAYEPVSARADDRRPLSRLPLPATPTVGREKDLAKLCALIEDPQTRLVTIVGTGGVGKTRLAVELVHAVGQRFSDGAHFVSLASVRRHQDVGSTIARSIDLYLDPVYSVEELLIQYCAERELLLVLDNFEHLLDAVPPVVDLLAASRRLKVVTTSRERLHVRAERVFVLAPFDVSAPTPSAPIADRGAPAIALFTEVARATRPEFELGPADLPLVNEICWRLDGLPLAIELAAGSLTVLAIPELAERAQQGLDVLSRGPRDAPVRQRTLRATLEWSYDLLSARERRAFASLSVFRGGFTRSAANAVAGVSLEVLEALVNKQLITATPTEHGLRFGMLATIRGFARERLDELRDAIDVRRRYVDHYVGFAERRGPELLRSGSRAVAAELEREIDNLRAAFARAVHVGGTEPALRLAIALGPYWVFRVDAEGLSWFSEALALPAGDGLAALRAKALAWFVLNDPDRDWSAAEVAARESLELHRSLGDPAGLGLSHHALALATARQGRSEEAFAHAHQAVTLFRQLEDPLWLSHALIIAAYSAPTLTQAKTLAEEAFAGFRTAGNWWSISKLELALIMTALKYGDYREAERHLLSARRAAIAGGDDRQVGYTHGLEGVLALLGGDVLRAADAFVLYLDSTERGLMPHPAFLAGIAMVSAHAHDDVVAATLLGADAVHTKAPDPGVREHYRQHFIGAARDRLGRERWDAAFAQGQRLTLAEAITLARQALTVPPSVAAPPVVGE